MPCIQSHHACCINSEVIECRAMGQNRGTYHFGLTLKRGIEIPTDQKLTPLRQGRQRGIQPGPRGLA